MDTGFGLPVGICLDIYRENTEFVQWSEHGAFQLLSKTFLYFIVICFLLNRLIVILLFGQFLTINFERKDVKYAIECRFRPTAHEFWSNS